MTTIADDLAEALRGMTEWVELFWLANENTELERSTLVRHAHAALSRYEASKQPAPITSKPGWDGRQYAEARGDYPLEVEDDKPALKAGRAM